MEVRINVEPVAREWERLRGHFPGLPSIDAEIVKTVETVAQAYNIPVEQATFLVAGKALMMVPEFMKESLTEAELRQPDGTWRTLRRRARMQVARLFRKGGAAR